METTQTTTDSRAVPDPRATDASASLHHEQGDPWPFLTLAPSELAYLVEHRVLRVDAESPIALLLEQADRASSPGARTLSEGRRLRDKGLIQQLPPEGHGGAEPAGSEAGALFRCALEVLARPEARLIIVRQSPGEQPSLIPLFLSGELAAPGFIDDEGLHVGVPMDRQQLLESVRINVHGDDSSQLDKPVRLSPLALQAVETLWRGTGRALEEVIPRHQARTLLAALTGDAEVVQGLLRLLLQAGVTEERAGGYGLSDQYRPWLERVLSGHSCAVELLPIGTTGPAEATQPDRLLFFGPPGQRVLCSQPEAANAGERDSGESEEWASTYGSPDEPALHFSAPSERLLSWKLRRMLDPAS